MASCGREQHGVQAGRGDSIRPACCQDEVGVGALETPLSCFLMCPHSQGLQQHCLGVGGGIGPVLGPDRANWSLGNGQALAPGNVLSPGPAYKQQPGWREVGARWNRLCIHQRAAASGPALPALRRVVTVAAQLYANVFAWLYLSAAFGFL